MRLGYVFGSLRGVCSFDLDDVMIGDDIGYRERFYLVNRQWIDCVGVTCWQGDSLNSPAIIIIESAAGGLFVISVIIASTSLNLLRDE